MAPRNWQIRVANHAPPGDHKRLQARPQCQPVGASSKPTHVKNTRRVDKPPPRVKPKPLQELATWKPRVSGLALRGNHVASRTPPTSPIKLNNPFATTSPRKKSPPSSDVDARGCKGRTLLHAAVVFGRRDSTEVLLAMGADPSVKGDDGKDVVLLAEEMTLKHPGVAVREEILNLVRMVSAWGPSEPPATPRPANDSAQREITASGTLVGGGNEARSPSELEIPLLDSMETEDSRMGTSGQLKTPEKGMPLLDAMETDEDVRIGPSGQAEIPEQDMPRKVDESPQGSPGEENQATPPCVVNSWDLVAAMMSFTDILDDDERKRRMVGRLYARLLSTDQITSLVVSHAVAKRGFRVHVDCGSTTIDRMKAAVRDHDGRKRGGRDLHFFADFGERKLYVGGLADEFTGEEGVLCQLAIGLAQMANYVAFDNGGRPYAKGDLLRERRFGEILAEAEDRSWGLNPILSRPLRKATLPGKEMGLASAVPGIIAGYGSREGRRIVDGQLPSLLRYYEDHVMTALRTQEERLCSDISGVRVGALQTGGESCLEHQGTPGDQSLPSWSSVTTSLSSTCFLSAAQGLVGAPTSLSTSTSYYRSR